MPVPKVITGSRIFVLNLAEDDSERPYESLESALPDEAIAPVTRIKEE